MLGIDVYIHVTFLLLLGFIGVSHWLAERSLSAAVSGTLFFLALFACVLLHEYGHALMARRYGIPTRDITLLPIGGVARLERMPERPSQELRVALAGPAVNVGIAAALAVWLTLTNSWEPLSSLSTTQGSFVERLLAVNLFLVVFNLLPAFPMDGGRVLRALLSMSLEPARATRIAARIGQGMAVLFGLAGFLGNPMLILIAVFVWFGAAQEAASAEAKSLFSGVAVRDAMVTDFRRLSPRDTAGEAAQLLLAGSQQDFPVVEDGRVVGVLTHLDLVAALRSRGEEVPVGEIMDREFDSARADESLDQALARVEPGRHQMLPVFLRNELVGLLTAENAGEFHLVRAALIAPPRRLPPPLPPRLSAPPLIPR
jgi:Zn-dependent protease